MSTEGEKMDKKILNTYNSFINDPDWNKNKVFKDREEFEKAKEKLYGKSIDKLLDAIFGEDRDGEKEQTILQKQLDQKMAIADELMKGRIQEEENVNTTKSPETNDNVQEKFNEILESYLEHHNQRVQIEKEIAILKSIQQGVNLVQEDKNSEKDNVNNEPITDNISNIETETTSENFDDIVEILKNNKISQIVVAGKYDKEKEIVKPLADLDTKIASYLLGYLNKKPVKDMFEEGAVTSFIGKGGEKKYEINNIKGGVLYPLNFKDGEFTMSNQGTNLIENKNDVKIILDTGGEWMKVIQNGNEKIVYIDHHGSGRREATSGTKMVYDIMKKAEILEDKPWVKNLVDFVNDVDNLLYVDKEDHNGHRLFTENYFRNEWPMTLYALAEHKIPSMGIIKLFESGIMKDYRKSFTNKEIEEMGNILIKNGDKNNTTTNKGVFLRNFININKVKKIRENIENNINAIRNITRYNSEVQKLNLESKIFGKIMYQNFRSKHSVIEDGKKKMVSDLFDKWMGYKLIKSRNMDSMIFWDRLHKEFFINSTKGDLVELAKRLNDIDPGCVSLGKDIRGIFIFGKIKNLTERQFLDAIDPEIAKNAKLKVSNP